MWAARNAFMTLAAAGAGGQWWTWGYTTGSGYGGVAPRSSPIQVGTFSGWGQHSSGCVENTTANITSTGALWVTGNNSFGQLGLGNTTNFNSPKQVGLLTTWANVSTGECTLAVKTDGTLWAWGQNTNGELGIGTVIAISSPVQVGSLTTWAKVSTGYKSTLAIKTDGTLWAWGRNTTYGELGLNNIVSYSSPKQVGSLTNWASAVINNGFSSLAVKTNGTLWSWGRDQFGELGLGTYGTSYSSPKQIGALTTWSTPAVGKSMSAAIKTDGTLWTWGRGAYGRLGQSSTTSFYSPKQVGSLTNWLQVSCNNWCISFKTNGTIWTWGNNGSGQLGDGTTTTRSSPVQVGALTNWLTCAAGASVALATKK